MSAPALIEVTLLVSGESVYRTIQVVGIEARTAEDLDTAVNVAIGQLQASWSLDDRMNTDVELVGVRRVTA